MCGRTSLTHPGSELALAFGLDEIPELKPRYNIAPSRPLAIVRQDELGRWRLAEVRWGLVPSWAQDSAIGNRMINARSESVDAKPAFRDAFQQRRCLIAASAFFEWQKRGKTRQPYLIHRRDGGPMAFAGLWESWRDGSGGVPLETCAILTTDANAAVRPLHDRMPVILAGLELASWLDPTAELPALRCLLAPSPPDDLEAFPVSTRVNSPDNDDPEIIRRIEVPVTAAAERQMTLWGGFGG